jgi:hypothetical protein
VSISFKIPKEDKKFLEWFAKKKAEPIGSIYRLATLDEFHKWKLNELTSLYSKGELAFKEMCDLGGITLTKGMLLLQENDIDPPIPDVIDEYTISLTLKNIKDRKTDIYKNGKGILRETEEVQPQK